MAKKKNNRTVLIVILIIIALFAFGNTGKKEAIIGTETMIRNMDADVVPSETFQVDYSVQGVTGAWGVIIEDTIEGGCTFPDGTDTLQTVMLSTDSTTMSVEVSAGSTEVTCIFNGDYQFGNFPEKTFPENSITVEEEETGTTPECTGTETRICTAASGCAGVQLCSSESWGTCTTDLTLCTDGTCALTCESGDAPVSTSDSDDSDQNLQLIIMAVAGFIIMRVAGAG